MRCRGRHGASAIIISIVLAVVTVAGCTRSVGGLAVSDSDAALPRRDGPWREHVLPSDCLLTLDEMSALTGVTIARADPTDLQLSDGNFAHNCSYYGKPTRGRLTRWTALIATIKVVSPSSGGVITDAMLAKVMAPASTELTGLGRRTVVEPLTSPDSFPVMRVATDKYLVHVVLVVGTITAVPDLAQWRRAAVAVLAALPAE